MEINDINIKEKELLSRAFESFNVSIQKLRKYQGKLEHQVESLNNELGRKNQELTNVLESLSNGLIVTDLEGKIITFNRAAASITGVKKDQALHQSINDLLAHEILPQSFDLEFFDDYSSKQRQQFTYIKNSGEKIIVEFTLTGMTSEKEALLGIIVNLNDVTQLKKLKEEAERKNRLTAMGEIAANVAHEIRNPLGSIELFVSLLKRGTKNDPEKLDLMHHISSGVRSMNHIISNLLQYAKPRPIIREKLDLQELMENFIEFSEHMARQQNIEIIAGMNAQDRYINGDSELIKQVLLNLFVNAMQASPEGGKIYFETQNILESDPDNLKRFPAYLVSDNQPLSLISCIIKDTGKGMTEEEMRQAFDPFFTTKERGTGLGMSIVQNIIASHNGAITVDSAPNEGATITLFFPVSRSE